MGQFPGRLISEASDGWASRFCLYSLYFFHFVTSMLKPCHLLTCHKRTEMKLYLNFRDELLVLETTEIAYIEASGNYSCILFMKGGKKLLAMTLSKLESLICLPSEEISSKFVRIGRSLIINQDYLTCVNLIKEEIVLSDYNNHIYTLPVSKFLLKKYKSRFFSSLSVE